MSNFVWLQSGDRLPAVAVAQKLLNRAGARLRCDGDFGRQTEQAVKAFQRARGLDDDGIIGRLTWPRLSFGADLPIGDTVDVFDGDLFRGEVRDLRRVGADPIVIAGMRDGLSELVGQIRARHRNLFLLRFHGHGAPGIASISDGEGLDDGCEPDTAWELNAASRAAMGQLRSVFGPWGCIQFMHCEVGYGTRGSRFLEMVAEAARVPASAAVDIQDAGGLRFTIRFEGFVRTRCPGGGRVSAWGEALPDFTPVTVP